mmetsp:Transcript_49740/g.98014  ORF Transcript_49740/g.98014 Transcript_49740/m.98014 type:complete len:119 (-) Transcript_49740:254-610(-)
MPLACEVMPLFLIPTLSTYFSLLFTLNETERNLATVTACQQSTSSSSPKGTGPPPLVIKEEERSAFAFYPSLLVSRSISPPLPSHPFLHSLFIQTERDRTEPHQSNSSARLYFMSGSS